jgi:manganese-dependent inorganic pyrophosphatase
MIYVIGHRNPDTDSVVSALVFSSYLKKKKIKNFPAVLDRINKESCFVLNLIKQEKPLILEKANQKDYFYLVDHASFEQSIPGLEKDKILGILDHHKLSGLVTDEPVFYRSEVLGSTASLVFKVFQEAGFKVNKKEAGLLLSGIVSDTLNLTSPTATLYDKKTALFLEKISGLEIKKLAQGMFQAKSDISGMKTKEIVQADYKEFSFAKAKIGFGVYETVASSSLDSIKEDVFKEIEKIRKENSLDYVFFGLIDIIKKQCFLYLSSFKEKDLAEKTFKGSYQEDKIYLIPGIVSRKKQIIPLLSKKLS